MRAAELAQGSRRCKRGGRSRKFCFGVLQPRSLADTVRAEPWGIRGSHVYLARSVGTLAGRNQQPGGTPNERSSRACRSLRRRSTGLAPRSPAAPRGWPGPEWCVHRGGASIGREPRRSFAGSARGMRSRGLRSSQGARSRELVSPRVCLPLSTNDLRCQPTKLSANAPFIHERRAAAPGAANAITPRHSSGRGRSPLAPRCRGSEPPVRHRNHD